MENDELYNKLYELVGRTEANRIDESHDETMIWIHEALDQFPDVVELILSK